jgi:uncharacterized protein
VHPIECHSIEELDTMSDRVFRLMERHQRIEDRLHSLRTLRWPDPFEIARLKKLKLAIKDRVANALRQRVQGRQTAG